MVQSPFATQKKKSSAQCSPGGGDGDRARQAVSNGMARPRCWFSDESVKGDHRRARRGRNDQVSSPSMSRGKRQRFPDGGVVFFGGDRMSAPSCNTSYRGPCAS